MDFKVCLLLTFLLVAAANGQTTPSSLQAETPSPSPKTSITKPDETYSTTQDDNPLKTSESTDKYTVSDAAKSKKQQLKKDEDNSLDEDNDDELAELVMIEAISGDNVKNEDNTDPEDDDSSSDETDLIREDEFSPYPLDPAVAATPENTGIRRQGDINPDFRQLQLRPRIDNSQPGNSDSPFAAPPRYSPRLFHRDRIQAASDSTPLLQLTQGGYQPPYGQTNRFNRQRDASKSESNTEQQADTTETSEANVKNNDQGRRPKIVPQVTYNTPFRAPPHGFGQGPIFRNPFPSRGFIPTNGIVPTTVQNSILHNPPTGFTDFSSTNFPTQFPASNDIVGYPAFARDPSSLPLFQVQTRNIFQNPSLLFQSTPQFAQPQQAAVDPSRGLHSPFQSSSFTGYPNFETVEDASRPDYAAYFRNPSPMNPQFQVPPNFYGTTPNSARQIFNNPPISLLSNYPSDDSGSPLSSRFLRYPMTGSQAFSQNNDQMREQQKDSDTTLNEQQQKKETEQINESPNKEDPTSVPFGTRLQRQNDEVYMRYPMREAGYATEENLPPQNASGETKSSDNSDKDPLPPFPERSQFPMPDSNDPYRDALRNLQQGAMRNSQGNNPNSTNAFEFSGGQLFRNEPPQFGYPQPPSQVFVSYPDRNSDGPSFARSPFFPTPGAEDTRNPFDQLAPLPDNTYQFLNNQPGRNRGSEETDKTPLCAQKTNASMCFEDADYPRREILYSLNTDSFLLDRLAAPDMQLDSIALVVQNTSEANPSPENYVCKTDIKYGTPMRAKNVMGVWKVIVNLDNAVARGRFIQPVRLEVCRGTGDPCSYIDSRVKTTCVQKYSLQTLLSWSPNRGVHNDVYKFPIACSCQTVDAIQIV